MKLSATVLATLCAAAAGAGCESAYVMNRDTTPEPILVIEEEPEAQEVVEPRFAEPPPGVTHVRPAPAPAPAPPKHAATNECGPCGMG